mgnify:CR=1 FL=1
MTKESTPMTLPVAVIGAGPVGLAAAAHLIERGLGHLQPPLPELSLLVHRSRTTLDQQREGGPDVRNVTSDPTPDPR